MDNLDKLATCLYGRKAECKDWLGGNNAVILLAAVFEIERLRRAAGISEAQNTSANTTKVCNCPGGACEFCDNHELCGTCRDFRYFRHWATATVR